MFIGEYNHTVDQKGRIAVPVKFRLSLGAGAIVTRGLDHCLFVFEKGEWEKLAQKLIAMPIAQSNSRAFARLMLAGAMEAELDAQGRILLPDYLREYASLGKRAVVAGLYNRLEIWDEKAWSQYKEKTEASGDDIAEKLGSLGI
ncbi:MAG: division/cell wall cluster transcriptional repressor MraZ [Patescibacteria group bacterium]|nr:division/cell wall cluster transcriptional repressor MraZ [Patescibacteria group bacterium]